MHVNNKTKQELLDLIEDVKMQDEAFKNLKARINLKIASLEIRKAIALYESSPEHLTRFASEGDMKGMRSMVHSRQALIEFVIKKSTPNLSIV